MIGWFDRKKPEGRGYRGSFELSGAHPAAVQFAALNTEKLLELMRQCFIGGYRRARMGPAARPCSTIWKRLFEKNLGYALRSSSHKMLCIWLPEYYSA